MTQLLNDIMELKPTIFPAVPRVLNKVYDRVYGQLESKPAILKVFCAILYYDNDFISYIWNDFWIIQ